MKSVSFQNQRMLGFATGLFGAVVILVTASMGFISLRLSQLGPYAEQILDRLIPILLLGYACEVFLFLLIAYFVAGYIARILSGPIDQIEKKIESTIKEPDIRPLAVAPGHMMEGLVMKINGILQVAHRSQVKKIFQMS